MKTKVLVRRQSAVAWIAVLLAMCVLAPETHAEDICIGPSEDVTTAVSLRDGASTSTAVVGRLVPNEQLHLTGEVPYWYQVILVTGVQAFASKRWTDVFDCAAQPVASGAFEVHAIDVGTGLSLFVRGPDFALLYDAGSNDDLAKQDRNRVLAYLAQIAPDLARIDHVVLSHPHRDHVELLADIFDRYDVGDVWNSGAFNGICGYRAFLHAISQEPGVRYHTALDHYGNEVVDYANGCRSPPERITLRHGARITADPIVLGANASMRFLYIDGSKRSDLNDNSLVLRLDLGDHRILLMGDAGGGSRQLPTTAPKASSIEGVLLACCKEDLRADVLVVGHHGSMTSSRTAFLDAVQAKVFLVSSGPFKYSGTMLPDAEVIEELKRRGALWRTDVDDAACDVNPNKTGPDADDRAGGCSNIRVQLAPGSIQMIYMPPP